jgi:hypothetical protein
VISPLAEIALVAGAAAFGALVLVLDYTRKEGK